MGVRFEPGPRARWEREIRAQPTFDTAMHLRARELATAVRAVAPDETGYYRRRIRVIGNSVVATDPFGHLVEFGSVNNPAYAPLRRGTLAVGLRLDITLL